MTISFETLTMRFEALGGLGCQKYFRRGCRQRFLRKKFLCRSVPGVEVVCIIRGKQVGTNPLRGEPTERFQVMQTVLIVDDNPADRALFRNVLGRAGFNVVEVAATGATRWRRPASTGRGRSCSM